MSFTFSTPNPRGRNISKKLDVKTFLFSSSNRETQICNGRKSCLSKLLSLVQNSYKLEIMYQHQGLKVRKNKAKPSPPSERGLLNELKIGVRLFLRFCLTHFTAWSSAIDVHSLQFSGPTWHCRPPQAHRRIRSLPRTLCKTWPEPTRDCQRTGREGLHRGTVGKIF